MFNDTGGLMCRSPHQLHDGCTLHRGISNGEPPLSGDMAGEPCEKCGEIFPVKWNGEEIQREKKSKNPAIGVWHSWIEQLDISWVFGSSLARVSLTLRICTSKFQRSPGSCSTSQDDPKNIEVTKDYQMIFGVGSIEIMDRGAAKQHVHPRRLTAVELSEHLPGGLGFPRGAQFKGVQKANKLDLIKEISSGDLLGIKKTRKDSYTRPEYEPNPSFRHHLDKEPFWVVRLCKKMQEICPALVIAACLAKVHKHSPS